MTIDTVGPVRSGNDRFDEAFEHLREYHLCQHWPGERGHIALYISQRPVGLLSKKKWSLYLDALLTVSSDSQVGQHRELSGRVGYFILDGKMEAPPQGEKGN